jgi:hypothetical protein
MFKSVNNNGSIRVKMKLIWKLGSRCRGNMFVCDSVPQQQFLYICSSHGRCPATGLHVTISLILDFIYTQFITILKATDKFTQAVMFLNYIQEVFVSNLDLGADYYKAVRDFLQCALANIGTVLLIRPRTVPFTLFPIHIIA